MSGEDYRILSDEGSTDDNTNEARILEVFSHKGKYMVILIKECLLIKLIFRL